MKRLTKHHMRLNAIHVSNRLGMSIYKKPSIYKNPRKLKKAMKKILIDIWEEVHGQTMRELHCKLHWVPGRGWTITQRS